MRLRNLFITFTLIILGFDSVAQLKSKTAFNSERLQINSSGMVILTSWAGLNIATGALGWATTTTGESKYFNQMNVFWNIVNLGIATPGLFKKRNQAPNIERGDLIQKQYATEQIYLINNALNVLYIGSGLLLNSYADGYPTNQLRFQGYGKSMALQGGFLLIFDTIQLLRHRNHRKSSKSLFFDNLSMSSSGIGLKYNFK